MSLVDSEVFEIKWREDKDAESILSFVGVAFVYSTISMQSINWEESANNCARMFNPLNEEKIEDYMSCMKRGDVFPAVVVESTPSGFVILGGNQRSNGAKRLNVTRASAYVVKNLTTSQRECIIRSLNARHGWGTSKSERIDHAVYLVRAMGISTEDASRLMVVSKTVINSTIRAEEMKASLAKSGIESGKLSKSHVDALVKIQDEEIQEEVARIAISKCATAESVSNLADCIGKAKGKASKSAKIKEWSKDLLPVESNKRRLGTPRRDKFLRLLSSMNDFLERGNDGTGFSTLDELQCTKNDEDKIKVLSSKILIRLKSIAGV